MKPSSWTKAAPYKETPFHRTPSESIANNYSPAAQNLKINTLNKRKKTDVNGNTEIPRKRVPTSYKRSRSPQR